MQIKRNIDNNRSGASPGKSVWVAVKRGRGAHRIEAKTPKASSCEATQPNPPCNLHESFWHRYKGSSEEKLNAAKC